MSTEAEIPGLKKRLTANELFVGPLTVNEDKIGVGTATPGEQLQLTGNLQVDGNLQVGRVEVGNGTASIFGKLSINGGKDAKDLLVIDAERESDIVYLSRTPGSAEWHVGTGNEVAAGGLSSFFWQSEENRNAMALTADGDLHVSGKLLLDGVEVVGVELIKYQHMNDDVKWSETHPGSGWFERGRQKVLKVNGVYLGFVNR